MEKMLVIDDDVDACETLQSLITRRKYHCDTAFTLQEGLELALAHGYAVIFLDVHLPDGNGLDILPQLMELETRPEVIILTGQGDPDGAELAINQGVWDYLVKPSSVRDITLTLNQALKYHRERTSRIRQESFHAKGLVGSGPAITACLQQAGRAAQSTANVLITGETGTGKELFASVIHENSRQAQRSFVVVDCASLTETLVESILFGHRKGAFTGADGDRIGLIKQADGGTLFLDEVGEMPLSLQKVFLRVLQEHRFRPVGSAREETSHFRLIAATNRNLDAMVDKGEFRLDLLYRIRTMELHLPPLRQRSEDIVALVNARMEHLATTQGMEMKKLGADFLDALQHYDWPGNVRELFNHLERAMVEVGNESTLFAVHLPGRLRIRLAKKHIRQQIEIGQDEPGPSSSSTESPVKAPAAPIFSKTDINSLLLEEDVLLEEARNEPAHPHQPGKICAKNAEPTAAKPLEGNREEDSLGLLIEKEIPLFKEFKQEAERLYLQKILARCHGDLSLLLDLSGLSRSHFYALLKKYDLTM